MSHHAGLPSQVILVATLPSAEGKVRVVMEKIGNGLTLGVKRAGKRLELFPAPGEISAFDVPHWFTSVLRATAPTVNGKELAAWQSQVRRCIPSVGGFTTICVGPKSEFHRCHLLHIDPQNVFFGRQGSTLGISAQVHGQQFPNGTLLSSWAIICRTSSVRHALSLQKRIRRSGETLVSLDQDIKGIIAFNRRRWDCAGVSEKDVLKFAADLKVSLRQIGNDGPGLAFLVRGT